MYRTELVASQYRTELVATVGSRINGKQSSLIPNLILENLANVSTEYSVFFWVKVKTKAFSRNDAKVFRSQSW